MIQNLEWVLKLSLVCPTLTVPFSVSALPSFLFLSAASGFSCFSLAKHVILKFTSLLRYLLFSFPPTKIGSWNQFNCAIVKLAGKLPTAWVLHSWQTQKGEGQWRLQRTQGPGSVLANCCPRNSPSSFYTNHMEGSEHRLVVTFSDPSAILMVMRLKTMDLRERKKILKNNPNSLVLRAQNVQGEYLGHWLVIVSNGAWSQDRSHWELCLLSVGKNLLRSVTGSRLGGEPLQACPQKLQESSHPTSFQKPIFPSLCPIEGQCFLAMDFRVEQMWAQSFGLSMMNLEIWC